MSQLTTDLQIARSEAISLVVVAALAAVGIITLMPASGGYDQAVVAVPFLTGVLAIFMVVRTGQGLDRARQEAGSATANDPLTGVATAAAGEQVLAMEFSAAQRERDRLLTVVLIGVDHMGRYRVDHGEVVTQKLVREIGRVLSQHRRAMHLTARTAVGPGVFLSVLSGIDRDGAAVYATRVRRELLSLPGLPQPAGYSAGIASFDMSMQSPNELLRRAAFALKKGAAAGGKVVVVGGHAPAEVGGAQRFF